MRNSAIHVAVCLMSFGLCFLAGCQEAQQSGAGSGNVKRRAQILGSENIQLKKQVTDLEKQVADLKQQLEIKDAEYQRFQTEQAQIYADLFETMAGYEKELEKYQNVEPK